MSNEQQPSYRLSNKPQSPRRWKSILRICIYGQILWAIYAGLFAQNVITFDPGMIGDLLLQCSFLLLMIFASIALCKIDVSNGRRFALLAVEVGLIITCFVAVLPAVQ